MTTDTRYNGWTNYATWRVNLEVFDGFDTDGTTYTPDMCRQYVDDFVDDSIRADVGAGAILAGWIASFLSDVDWREIAAHVNEENGTDTGGRMTDRNSTYTYRAGTRLSNAYTLGRDGKPRPKWAGVATSAASLAWKQGHAEFVAQEAKRDACVTTAGRIVCADCAEGTV